MRVYVCVTVCARFENSLVRARMHARTYARGNTLTQTFSLRKKNRTQNKQANEHTQGDFTSR